MKRPIFSVQPQVCHIQLFTTHLLGKARVTLTPGPASTAARARQEKRALRGHWARGAWVCRTRGHRWTSTASSPSVWVAARARGCRSGGGDALHAAKGSPGAPQALAPRHARPGVGRWRLPALWTEVGGAAGWLSWN